MKSTRWLAVAALLVPFAVLASHYSELPAELTVLRSGMGKAVRVAAKSLFVVFRVPLMNLTHGLMAMTMMPRASDFEVYERRRAFLGVFATLVWAIAVKSNFEALEIVAGHSAWLVWATLSSVVVGLGLAVWRGRGVRLPWSELRLGWPEWTVLAISFVAYLAIVAATFAVSRRADGVG